METAVKMLMWDILKLLAVGIRVVVNYLLPNSQIIYY